MVNISEDMELFTGVVKRYVQDTDKFEVQYHKDGVKEMYDTAELHKYLSLFEECYARVSRKGQRFTREQALPVIIKGYRRDQLQKKSKTCAVSSAASAASAAATSETEADKERLSATIGSMRVTELRALLKSHNLNETGLKVELVQRLCGHLKCPVPQKKKAAEPGKHKATWHRKQTKNNKSTRFTDRDFNDASLRKNLPGYPDRVPEPWECHNFFYTDEMWGLGHAAFHAYPKYVASQQVRPPWTAKNQPWPPVWVKKPMSINLVVYKFFFMLLYLMGLKRLGRNSLRHMFSSDEFLQEIWLKKMTTNRKFEAFLRQLHFEDSGDPWGKKYPHSTDYRPNGVPKVR